MEEIVNKIKFYEPYYFELNCNYSDAYLQGSPWYVGESLEEWWNKCGKVYTFRKNYKKLKSIFLFLDSIFFKKIDVS